MSYVFLLDTEQRPLDPIHPGYARRLLTQGKAAMWRRYPFTLILKARQVEAAAAPLRLKLDPGSKTTGLAIVHDASGAVIWAAELTHRGEQIKAALLARRARRRGRRSRHTRYRPCRFQNRRRRADWLPPSMESRVSNVKTWVARLRRLCPIAALSVELVKFDTTLLQNPTISGLAYQQGTLAGYEVREYVLEKWGRRCAYCHQESSQFEIDHIVPRSRGGSNRPSNLALACHHCNQEKGDRTAEEYGHPEVQAQAKLPLRDAAAVNATRWRLYERLKASGLPVETGTGGRTKWNRTRRELPKAHWCDALCVGASTPEHLTIKHLVPLLITAMGRQRRQMCLVDRFGFPRTKAKQSSVVRGFRTGDLVKAVVPSHLKHPGVHVGRVAVKANGAFTIATTQGNVPDISWRYCTKLQGSDGYSYQKGDTRLLPIR